MLLIILQNVDMLNPFFIRNIDDTSWKSLSGVRANKRILQLVPNVEVWCISVLFFFPLKEKKYPYKIGQLSWWCKGLEKYLNFSQWWMDSSSPFSLVLCMWGTGRVVVGLALLYCSCALWYCGLLYAKHMYFRIFNPCYDVLNYGQKDEEYMGL